MIKKKSKVFIVFMVTIALVFAIFFTIYSQYKAKNASIENQLKSLQEDYSGIIQQIDSKYGRLVFYSLDKNEFHGVGLALFKKQDNHWWYIKGTAHLIDMGAGTVDQIILNKDTKVIYGYYNERPINTIKEIDNSELKDGIFYISNSKINYAFVQHDFMFKTRLK